MRNVIKLEAKAVTHRYCPGCGFWLTQIQVEGAASNLDCKNHCGAKINDFLPVRDRAAMSQNCR